jgi:hypothetical protein
MSNVGVYTKVIGFYPMIGVSESTQRLNAKVVSGTRQSAYDINFNGGWTFSILGARGDGSSGTYWYIDYNHRNIGDIEDSHFGTYQTEAGSNSTRAYDISVTQQGGGDVFVAMMADWNATGDGVYDYDIVGGVDFGPACTEPISNMMSFIQSDNRNHVFQNEVKQSDGFGGASLDKDTYIYGGTDLADEQYTNRGFGFITFGKLLDDGEMEGYQKLINRFETSMSRNIY